MSLEQVRREFGRARDEFSTDLRLRRAHRRRARLAGRRRTAVRSMTRRTCSTPATPAAVPRFLPEIDGRVSRTLEIPSTLPTFDELLGRPEYPEAGIVEHYSACCAIDRPNVLTIHAEIEGMMKRPLFRDLLTAMKERGVRFVRMDDLARRDS